MKTISGIELRDADHLTVLNRDMWFGDPFHVLPSDLWDEFKAVLAAENRNGGNIALGGVVTIAGSECLYIATARGAGRFLVWHDGTSQRIFTDSFLLALMPLAIVDHFDMDGSRDRGFVIENMIGRVYIERDTRTWEGSISCETDNPESYSVFDKMHRWTQK